MEPFIGYDKKEIIRTRGECLTEKQRRKIWARNWKMCKLKRDEDWSWRKIGKEFGLSANYVKSVCHKIGINGSRKSGKKRIELPLKKAKKKRKVKVKIKKKRRRFDPVRRVVIE